jgi:PAS domain S-box-containing protein
LSKVSPSTTSLWSGDAHLLVDFAARSVFVDDSEIALTPTEFDVLACLARRVGEVVSTPELIEAVWGAWYGPTDHVFVHVHHIRRKLGPCGRLIVTKRKAGYLLRREVVPRRDEPAGADYLDLLTQDAQARGVVWLIADERRRVAWVSDSIIALLGWAPTDLVGSYPWDLVLDDERDAVAARFTMDGADSLLAFDARIRHVDGSIVSIGVVAQVLRGLDGDRLGGIGEWRLLPEAEATALHVTSEFRLHYDADHILVAVEPFESFLGWHPDDVVGSAFGLASMDGDAVDGLSRGSRDPRYEHALGIGTTLDADGQQVVVDIIVYLRFKGARLTGYTADVRVLD